MKRSINQVVLMMIHMKLRQFSLLRRKMGNGCMKPSCLAMLKLLGSLSITFQEDIVSDVAAALWLSVLMLKMSLLKNTHLGDKRERITGSRTEEVEK